MSVLVSRGSAKSPLGVADWLPIRLGHNLCSKLDAALTKSFKRNNYNMAHLAINRTTTALAPAEELVSSIPPDDDLDL
jgi:hypothetical protein